MAGRNVVLAIPAAAGRTLIAYLAILKWVTAGGRRGTFGIAAI